jgi:hypothetical protein
LPDFVVDDFVIPGSSALATTASDKTKIAAMVTAMMRFMLVSSPLSF